MEGEVPDRGKRRAKGQVRDRPQGRQLLTLALSIIPPHRAAFRLGAGEDRRVCLEGALHPGDEARLILKNALGLTVQDCRVAAGRRVVISAEKLDKGWRVGADCR
ncbi:MAG: hypothetical protein O7A68_01980 [Alphaproteobacteria bacterium]|nr:hypothetical protein [Alphaproteobacteria bacterium]